MTVSRRRLIQSLALTGGYGTAARGAEPTITLDVLRNVSATHGASLSDDRLRVVKPVLEHRLPELRALFQTCDVLMLPAGNAAPRLDAEIAGTDAPSDPPPPPRPDSFNIANMTGIPAIVLPCGFTVGPPSLPLGIQFCARPFDEPTLFRISHAYQSATDWHKRRPVLNG